MNDIFYCHFDAKGRIVIPAALRERFDLQNEVELVATKDGILVRAPQEN